MTHPQYGRINEGYARAFTLAMVVKKKHKSHSTTMAKFYETVVGNKSGKVIIEMNTDVLAVEELEISKAA